jgi:methionyl-tRNA formyltransferase
MNRLKTIFFGTPALSVPYLEAVNQLTDLQSVVTQADKPRGRGMEILPCPVKVRATQLGIRTYSPDKLKDIFEDIKNTPFELGVAVAFGKIFRPDFLALPKLGIINVHFSLLPLLRGAAPVQRALMEGFTKTGVSVFWIRPGLDDGPLLLQKEIPISPEDNAMTLFDKLVPLGLDALKEAVALLAGGKLPETAQAGEPTFAPMLEKEEAFLRPHDLTATQLHNRVRGLACGPKPKIPFTHKGKTEWVQVLQTRIAPLESQWEKAPCGAVLAVERGRGILVKCKESVLWLCALQPAGKKPMDGVSFANGRALKINEQVFTDND